MQGLIQRFGGAKYRFTRSYQNALSGSGASNKVQKVIKYIDKQVPRYFPKSGKVTSTTTSTTSTTPAPPPPLRQLEAEQHTRLANLANTFKKHNIGNYKNDSVVMDEAENMEQLLFKVGNRRFRRLSC